MDHLSPPGSARTMALRIKYWENIINIATAIIGSINNPTQLPIMAISFMVPPPIPSRFVKNSYKNAIVNIGTRPKMAPYIEYKKPPEIVLKSNMESMDETIIPNMHPGMVSYKQKLCLGR